MRTKSQLNKQAKHSTFYKFEEGISFAEHWKLVAESSEFNLTLKGAHRVHFCQLEIRQKKRDLTLSPLHYESKQPVLSSQ